MNVHLLINGIVQQTMVLIAQLATAGGIRAPLAQIADQVFGDLTNELLRQGVKKKVIADMFGMALRTYHRRERAAAESQTEAGRTVWDAVLAYIRDNQPATGAQVARRFHHDDPRTVTGVLHDMARSGFVYRTGEGDGAVYRIADQADLVESMNDARRDACEHLVWLTAYRHGPVGADVISSAIHLTAEEVHAALERLTSDDRVQVVQREGKVLYTSARLDVPLGTSRGWEAAVLDHFQAMVSAVCAKVRRGGMRTSHADATGGATFTFEVWPGHPHDAEARGLLGDVRARAYALRERIDAHNKELGVPDHVEPVVFYVGQYLRADERAEGESL